MASEPRPRLGAAGIGVTDLQRSVAFYTTVFGMRTAMEFSLPDMEEAVLTFRGGQTGLVLMQHHDHSGHDYASTGGKLVFYVADPASVAEEIRNEGYEIVREPAPVPELGGAVVGFAKDPDGYLLELLQA